MSISRTGSKYYLFFTAFILAFAFQLSGCGTVHEAGLQPGDTSLNLSYESLVLLAIKTENKYKPGYPPEVYRITVISDDDKKTEYKTALVDMNVSALIGKGLKDMSRMNKGDTWEDFVTLRLPPGPYRLASIAGGCISGLINGNFDFPFNNQFILGSQEVVYLGRIEMVNRERTSENEVPAGGKLPIIDQATSGFGGGTFDVTIYDNFDHDQMQFNNKYPALIKQKVVKQILGPWRKPPSENK